MGIGGRYTCRAEELTPCLGAGTLRSVEIPHELIAGGMSSLEGVRFGDGLSNRGRKFRPASADMLNSCCTVDL